MWIAGDTKISIIVDLRNFVLKYWEAYGAQWCSWGDLCRNWFVGTMAISRCIVSSFLCRRSQAYVRAMNSPSQHNEKGMIILIILNSSTYPYKRPLPGSPLKWRIWETSSLKGEWTEWGVGWQWYKVRSDSPLTNSKTDRQHEGYA